jgi:hypothetical protein
MGGVCHISQTWNFWILRVSKRAVGGLKEYCMTGFRIGLLVAMVGLSGASAWGKFAMPAEVPVERLIKNVGAYVKEHPKDAMGYYTLG